MTIRRRDFLGIISSLALNGQQSPEASKSRENNRVSELEREHLAFEVELKDLILQCQRLFKQVQKEITSSGRLILSRHTVEVFESLTSRYLENQDKRDQLTEKLLSFGQNVEKNNEQDIQNFLKLHSISKRIDILIKIVEDEYLKIKNFIYNQSYNA